jgi:SAM-dependent methyltransferase
MMKLIPARTTDADLKWWLELAPTLDWTFAKTYAQTAPHSYVVLGQTEGMTRADYIRAGAVIRTFGQPGKFYDNTNIYLTSADGALKWWAMDSRVADTTLINEAPTEQVYGEQNAPSTYSGHRSVYDEIATDYDRLYSPVDGDEKTGLLCLIDGLGLHDPAILDIGCGTGAVLDLGVTTADRYTGVDPSQAMLNELVIKQHGRLARIIPKRMEDALADLRPDKFELVIAAFGSASYLSADVLRQLPSLCSGSLLLMTYADAYSPGYYRLLLQADAAVAALELAVNSRDRVHRIGKFNVTLIDYAAGRAGVTR